MGIEFREANHDQVSQPSIESTIPSLPTRYGIDNIRDLVGHKVDLDMVQKNPLCRI